MDRGVASEKAKEEPSYKKKKANVSKEDWLVTVFNIVERCSMMKN